MKQNVLILMCDQFRFDCIGALGNEVLRTPNLDRIRRRGVAFSRAYSTCPICIPARYTIRTGRSPLSTGITTNLVTDGAKDNFGGAYLAQEMRDLGYRTFGIGKFHTVPHDEELGYDVHIHTEELYEPGCEMDDDYYRYVRSHHPEFNFVEQLHGERSEMYYQPQVSPLPAHLTVESWVADRAIEQIRIQNDRPYFGFVSFIEE